MNSLEIFRKEDGHGPSKKGKPIRDLKMGLQSISIISPNSNERNKHKNGDGNSSLQDGLGRVESNLVRFLLAKKIAVRPGPKSGRIEPNYLIK